MRCRRKRAKRWAALLLALPLAAGIVLFAAHLHRIFLEYAINECEDNALMEIGSLMEDEVYAHPERYTSLVQLDYDSERHVTALRTDVVAIGRIKSRLVNGLYDRLDEFEQTVIEVPVGSVLAPRFFSGRGPSLHFGLAGLTQMEAEFVSSFSAAGINQTRHCILIEFHAGFRILTPFGGEDREIVSTFPVTDTVIVGTVPERYAYIGSAGEGLLGEARDGSAE